MVLEQHRRVMALDLGDARIGVAVSDPLGLTAQPLLSIEQTGRKALRNVLALVKEYRVCTLVVGHPLELNGEQGEQAGKVHRFVSALEQALEKDPQQSRVRTVLWDERLTTAQAERIIAGSKLKNRDRRAALDRVAAALILESYLSARPVPDDSSQME